MRSYRSPIFGNIPPVIKNLLLINIVLFLADYVLGGMGINLTRLFALHNVQSSYFKPFQFVTHMFMHGSLTHIFFNMFALYMFGRMLEMVWGGKRFLIYYLVTGLGAATLHSLANYLSMSHMQTDLSALANTPTPELFLQYVRNYLPNASAEVNELINRYSEMPNSAGIQASVIQVADQIYQLHLNTPTVGASGAVFGVLLAFGMLFPNTQLMLLFPPIPIKAKWFVLGYGAIELFAVIMPRAGDNVAHLAHLGGMIFGYILIKYWRNRGIGNYQQF